MTSRQRAMDLRRQEAGWKRYTVWFKPEDNAMLGRLALEHGSVQKALEAGLKALAEKSQRG